MPKLSLLEQFEMLRVQFEFTVPPPSVVVVSSARGDDGKAVAAAGLAKSMQGAGYETLLVNADPGARPIGGVAKPDSVTSILEFGLERFVCKTSRAGSDVLVVSNESFRQGASRESVALLFTEFRESYQYVVIDAARIVDNNLALLFAVAADGVFLTVRSGRRVCAADRQLAAALQREDAKTLGVVAIDAATIRAATASAESQTAWSPKSSAAAPVEAGKRQQQAVS